MGKYGYKTSKSTLQRPCAKYLIFKSDETTNTLILQFSIFVCFGSTPFFIPSSQRKLTFLNLLYPLFGAEREQIVALRLLATLAIIGDQAYRECQLFAIKLLFRSLLMPGQQRTIKTRYLSYHAIVIVVARLANCALQKCVHAVLITEHEKALF